MPTLNFQKRFVPRILNGTKVHTIRIIGKRLHVAGEMLYMQTGPRFKPERFMTRPCIRVREIVLHEETLTIWNEDRSGFIVPPLDTFARADGFDSWQELSRFFIHPVPPTQLIQWAPAEWEL
jgi:hypothetical protein